MAGDENKKTTTERAFRVGDWLVEPPLDQVSRGGVVHKLEPRTMRLLARLAVAPGEVVSLQELLDSVWSGVVVGPASVYQAVSQLRKIFGDTEASPAYIATVPRRGYRLVAEVTRLDAPRAPASTEPAAVSAALRTPMPRGRPRWPWIAAVTALLGALVLAFAFLARDEPSTMAAAPPAGKPRIANALAVLPFQAERKDLGNPVEHAVMHLLFDRLVAIRALPLISLDSTYTFTDPERDIGDLGRKLHARYLLGGTVAQDGERLRIIVQLDDTSTGKRLWSTPFDRPAGEITRVREEIVQHIVDTLA